MCLSLVYVCTCVCMDVCMYVWVCIVRVYVWVYACINLRMHECIHLRMHACMRIYICNYTSLHTFSVYMWQTCEEAGQQFYNNNTSKMRAFERESIYADSPYSHWHVSKSKNASYPHESSAPQKPKNARSSFVLVHTQTRMHAFTHALNTTHVRIQK